MPSTTIVRTSYNAVDESRAKRALKRLTAKKPTMKGTIRGMTTGWRSMTST